MDAKNSAEVTRKWYASQLRFPLSFYYPSAWEEAARRRLAAVCDFDATPEAVEAYVSGALAGKRPAPTRLSPPSPSVDDNDGMWHDIADSHTFIAVGTWNDPYVLNSYSGCYS